MDGYRYAADLDLSKFFDRDQRCASVPEHDILLDDLDKELEKRGLPFVRYADDCAIFAKSERAAGRIMQSVTRYLTEELRLVVN